MEDESILNEFLERIKNLEQRNEQLRKDIENKKKEIKQLGNNFQTEDKKKENDENNKNKIEKEKVKKLTIPTEEEDKKIGERFLYEFKKNQMNSYDIEKNIKEITIEYISQEQLNSLYIMGDFTKWELIPMKKNKDIFSYKIVLLKGFKYYYSFQNRDQIIIDYNNVYEENPRTLQIQNFIDLSEDKNAPQQFDFENHMNILQATQNNYFLSKLGMDENEIQFLEKYKRHIIACKEINSQNEREYNELTDSIYNFYDQQLRYIQPYEIGSKLLNLKLFFKNRIFAHFQTDEKIKDKQYKYLFKIVDINIDYNFQCLKLYDNNNIKINMAYYNDIRSFYLINFDSISTEPISEKSKLYHLLSKEESEQILKDYNNDKNNILKAYFKTLTNLRNNNAINENIDPLLGGGFRHYIGNYGSIIVTPEKVEPIGINMNDYEFQYSYNRITKVKNKIEGSFIEYIAIDEAAEKAKKPFRYKIYYSIKNNKINLIHCHVLDKDLRDIKILVKEIDKNVNPQTLKKNEEYIKNNELLLIVLDSIPLKLYYKGKKVKMESIKIDENKLYLLMTENQDSYFNKMYVTVDKIEDKMKYDLVEQCNVYSNSFGDMQNGVDVHVSFDNNKNYAVEQMMLAVSPCLLKKLTFYEETLLKGNKIKAIKDKGLNEMDKYALICQKMDDFRKYNKEAIDKMEQKEKDEKLASLNEYKETLVIITKYFEENEMWENFEVVVNLASEIENLISLFQGK